MELRKMEETHKTARPLSDYPEVLDARSIAAYLQIGYHKALLLVRSGAFPSVRVGNAYRVSRSGFERWLCQEGFRVAL